MLEPVGFKLNRLALLTYSSPSVGLIEPPGQAHGKACYVFAYTTSAAWGSS